MQPLLELKNIKKNYYEKSKICKQALNDITLDLYSGEILGLLGVNGAGKTTLSSIIASLIPLTSGTIFWKGKSIYKDLLNYRRSLGFCPQKANLDSALTLEEILLYAGRYFGVSRYKERSEELLERLKLTDYAKLKAHVLSGGYKQRFLIARTMMHSPKLLILDEPTVGLDPHVRHELWAIIKELKEENITVILTTHYLDEADALCDRACILDSGEVLKIDSPKNLKAAVKESSLEQVFLKLIDQKAEQA